MSVIIRKGIKSDLPDVLKLIKELALFEKAPNEVTNTIADMEADGFGKDAAFEFYVAEENNSILGIALFFTKYSTWKGKGIYLDDLIVTEAHRGRGIGRLLLNRIILHAKEVNVKQLHWQVLDWNTPAIEFYKKIGSTIEAEWLDCKMNYELLKG